MLLRLKIKNFLSFYEETVFDMFPNIKREMFSNHVYNQMSVPLLKQAAVYGANGSGKSNFIKAFRFLREFIINENFLTSKDLDDYIFQLTKSKLLEIFFEIEFFHNQKYYIYSVDIGRREIREKLMYSGIGKTNDVLIFERKGLDVEAPAIQNKKAVRQLLSLNLKSSLLPLNLKFPVLSDNGAKQVYDWFAEKTAVISINSTISVLINLMSQQPKILNFANKVLKNVGVGVQGLEICNLPFDKWIYKERNTSKLQQIVENGDNENSNINRIKNDRNQLNITIQEGIKTVQELLFKQYGQSDYVEKMKISAQSDGTVRLLTLVPALYDAMYCEKTVFIDEIDNNIHPNLMFELLKFYADNESNGQLIFTTHTTRLLNQQELLRPDEVWFTAKDKGSTKMYSLNDFKIHNTINIENGYLDGRYGGVPVMSEVNAG